MKTQRTAWRATMNAQTKAITARIVIIVRSETVISTRFDDGSGVATRASLGPASEVACARPDGSSSDDDRVPLTRRCDRRAGAFRDLPGEAGIEPRGSASAESRSRA